MMATLTYLLPLLISPIRFGSMTEMAPSLIQVNFWETLQAMPFNLLTWTEMEISMRL
jgi:hypothetical protein